MSRFSGTLGVSMWGMFIGLIGLSLGPLNLGGMAVLCGAGGLVSSAVSSSYMLLAI